MSKNDNEYKFLKKWNEITNHIINGGELSNVAEVKYLCNTSTNTNRFFSLCCYHGNVNDLRYLYWKYNNDINLSFKNELPFRLSCAKGNYDMVKWLLDTDPNININIANDVSSLHISTNGTKLFKLLEDRYDMFKYYDEYDRYGMLDRVLYGIFKKENIELLDYIYKKYLVENNTIFSRLFSWKYDYVKIMFSKFYICSIEQSKMEIVKYLIENKYYENYYVDLTTAKDDNYSDFFTELVPHSCIYDNNLKHNIDDCNFALMGKYSLEDNITVFSELIKICVKPDKKVLLDIISILMKEIPKYQLIKYIYDTLNIEEYSLKNFLYACFYDNKDLMDFLCPKNYKYGYYYDDKINDYIYVIDGNKVLYTEIIGMGEINLMHLNRIIGSTILTSEGIKNEEYNYGSNNEYFRKYKYLHRKVRHMQGLELLEVIKKDTRYRFMFIDFDVDFNYNINFNDLMRKEKVCMICSKSNIGLTEKKRKKLAEEHYHMELYR